MGGAKKRSLKQAEKQQQLQAAKEQQQKKSVKQSKVDTSDKTGGINIQEITEKDLNELSKIKALTPFAVATKYNIRMNMAKNVLETLEKKKTVQKVASGGGLKIYRFVGEA